MNKKQKSLLLLTACKIGDLAQVQSLVANKANVHMLDDEALNIACKHNHLAIVKFLVENANAFINAKDTRALVSACKMGNKDIVSYLLEQKADIHALEDECLVLAVSKRDWVLCELLLYNGSYADTRDNLCAKLSVDNDDVFLLALLLRHGASVNTKDEYCIKECASKDYHKTLIFLVENQLVDLATVEKYASSQTREFLASLEEKNNLNSSIQTNSNKKDKFKL